MSNSNLHIKSFGFSGLFLRLMMLCLIGGLMPTNIHSQTEEINYRGWVRNQNNNKKERKVALVIGNNAYMHGSKLKEPTHDASRFASALQSQGYEVSIGYNLDRQSFLDVVNEFSKKFRLYDSGIIYYAGHGFQIDGKNYLIPIDANPTNKLEVDAQCINVDYFFEAINIPENPKLVILDACRNNPFAKNRNWISENRGATTGMAAMSPMSNSLIVFSTEKNTVVRDDNQFTEILSDHIESGGCVNSILGRVIKAVRKMDPSQRIQPEGWLEDDICFGEQQNSEAMMIDSDGDLIPDAVDKCPDVYGTVQAAGCPEDMGTSENLDSDNDGLIDAVDDCPDLKGTLENKGCPESIYNGPFDNGIIEDSRDKSKYKWVRLKDGKKWMATNLNYQSSDSWCYDDKNKNCKENGRYYTWSAAQKACPNGWRLPSAKEWEQIISLYGGEKKAYSTLISYNTHDFIPILGGGRQVEGEFCCENEFGEYWTSDDQSARAKYVDFNKSNSSVTIEKFSKQWGLSCRCIEDSLGLKTN